MPKERLREFSQAFKRGRMVQLLTLIDRLPPEGSGVGRFRADAVRVQAFDSLMVVTDRAFTDRLHG